MMGHKHYTYGEYARSFFALFAVMTTIMGYAVFESAPALLELAAMFGVSGFVFGLIVVLSGFTVYSFGRKILREE